MAITLPDLPFAKDSLAPHISEETIEFHYGKHHQGYVNKLNQLIDGTEYVDKDLIDIIKTSSGSILNNAAQIWNHSFYWNCLGGTSDEKELSEELMVAINKDFGSLEKFQESFNKEALSLFGSGWVWLVKGDNGLEILKTSNAGNLITQGKTPLLVCDVWEHAYYIDYRNARAKYLEAFWQIINWHFIGSQI